MAKNPEKTKRDERPFVVTAALSAAATTFGNAVNAFNSQNGNALSSCLDAEAVLFRKRDGGVVQRGHDKVLAVLETLFVDSGHGPASFTPLSSDPPAFRPPALPVIVSGSAAWHDNDGSADDTIKYEFVFDPGNSLIISLFAQHK